MKLIKVTKNKSKHFRLNDGRIGVIYKMKHFEVKYKNVLRNKNSSYYKKFNGILTKLVSCKNKEEIYKFDKNSNKIISIKEL